MSVQYHSLDYVGTSDYLAILSTIRLPLARDEEHHRTIWLWEHAYWQAMRRALTDTAWGATLSGDPQQDVITITTILHTLQQQHVPHRAYTTSPKDQPWFGYRCRVAAERKYNA